MNSLSEAMDSAVAESPGEAIEAAAPLASPHEAAPAVSAAGPESAAPVVSAAEPASQASLAPKIEDAAAAQRAEPAGPSAAPPVSANVGSARGDLIPFVAPQGAEPSPSAHSRFWRAAIERRFQIGAAAAALAAVGVIAASSISYGYQQVRSIEARNADVETMEETLKALKTRIGALEAARRDESADLRKTAAEIKSGLGATREVSAALAQMNARFERTERDGEARVEKLGERIDRDAAMRVVDFNARLEKLAERVDRDAAARVADMNARLEKIGERDRDAATHNADFAARIDKLEKKLAAPMVASAAPSPPAAAAAGVKPVPTPPTPPPTPGVSKETTASIAPRAPLRNWIVRDVHGGVAIVESRYGFREVAPGDILPGAGRVERIERRGSEWSVVTDGGVIAAAPEGNF